MYSYLIKPVDLIVFGNPSPFNRLEQSYRASEKILNPVPFYGALRRLSKSATIRFFSIVKEFHNKKKKVCFPLPYDIVRGYRGYITGILQRSLPEVLSDYREEYIVSFGEEKFSRRASYICDLKGYLMDTLQDGAKFETYEPFRSEVRVGIGIDRDTRTSAQGELYFEEFIRMEKDFYFYIETEENIHKDVLKIGGESRVCLMERSDEIISRGCLDKDLIEEIKRSIVKSGYFKLVLLTPTNMPCDVPGARLIAKVVGRPYIYSGWLRKDKDAFPSKIIKMINPGAVFYYKIEDANRSAFTEMLFERFWLKPSFFTPDFPYFESINGINPLCLGLTIIASLKEVKNE